MTLETLVENAIIADLLTVALLAQYPVRNRDYAGAKAGNDTFGEEEASAVITVTAKDNGEFKIGSGIKKVGVEVEVRVNAAIEGQELLPDQLSEQVDLRLQVSPAVANGLGREFVFSTPSLKVYGILSGATTRTDEGLERIRVIVRTFIAAKLA